MKLNWRPSKVAFIDFETQSECDLTSTTHSVYADHPTTRALTCCVKMDGGVLRLGPYLGDQEKQALRKIAEERVLVAHNAPFDAAIWKREGLGDATWFDTLPCCRAAGLPGKLDEVGIALTGEGKDKNGARLIDLLCILRPGKPPPAIGLAHQLLMEYNVRDVDLLEQIYSKVKDHVEPDVLDMDYAVNERGVPLDREFLLAMEDVYKTNGKLLEEEWNEKTHNVNPRSHKQVKEWMNSIGFVPPQVDGKASIGKIAFEKLQVDPESYFSGDGEVAEAAEFLMNAMETRRGVVRVGKGKIDTALRLLDVDDFIRWQHVYWGAHTGRWAGRGLQVQNFPHSIDQLEVLDVLPDMACVKGLSKYLSELTKKPVSTTDVLNAALRGMVQAPVMVVADYSAIELVGAAWFSGETRMLELLREGKSLYIDMGRKLFGRTLDKNKDFREYTLAKMMVLSCIYGVSGNRFEYRCKLLGVDTSPLAQYGLDVHKAVKLFRETYANVVSTWHTMNDAVKSAMNGIGVHAAKCYFHRVGRDVNVVLPSGRALVYRNARMEPRVPGYCKIFGLPEEPVPTIVFDLPRKEGFLYGSRIFENIVQAGMRDILAGALVNCEKGGLRPFLHVHDEGANLTDDIDAVAECMSTVPKWAPGFPLKIEGYIGNVWTKGPRKESIFSAMEGKVIHRPTGFSDYNWRKKDAA